MGQFVSYNWGVTGREFIERVYLLGREHGVEVSEDYKAGKGSHIRLYYGSRSTTVIDRRRDIGPPLLSMMIRQLGLERRDFR